MLLQLSNYMLDYRYHHDDHDQMMMHSTEFTSQSGPTKWKLAITFEALDKVLAQYGSIAQKLPMCADSLAPSPNDD